MPLSDVWSDPNVRWVLLGCMLLGLSGGVIGSFTYIRRQSLTGDVLAHAALPGVCLAYMAIGAKSVWAFVVGAALAGWAAVLCVGLLVRRSRLKADTALAAALSVFFGFGVVLLTFIQRGEGGNVSGLDAFLFGQAAAMTAGDVRAMATLSAVVLAAGVLFFKEFKLTGFDPEFARSIGFSAGRIDALLMSLVVVTVVAGIQAVGVVLMSAFLIAPAVAARCWTERFGRMVALAGVFGAVSGWVGGYAGTFSHQLPTGALAVLAASALFVLSLLFSPRRGLLARAVRRFVQRRMTRAEFRRAAVGVKKP